MQDFKDRVQEIIGKYEESLSDGGIKITVSKRYFETEVSERSTYSFAGNIFTQIERASDRKKEKENNYCYERNKYHYIVLTVLPADKALVRKEECKNYAFILRKVERAHIGLEPQLIIYEEDKVLGKIEKRILKILKKTKNHTSKEVCKDTLHDAFRYAFSCKYDYKDRILGKSRIFWDVASMIIAVILTFAVIFVPWAIDQLF